MHANIIILSNKIQKRKRKGPSLLGMKKIKGTKRKFCLALYTRHENLCVFKTTVFLLLNLPYSVNNLINVLRVNRCKLFAFGRIKNDDKLVQVEGVESLSEAELRQACRDRGLLGLLSVEEMRQQVNHKCFSGICGIELSNSEFMALAIFMNKKLVFLVSEVRTIIFP